MSSSLAERLAVRPPSVTAVIDGLVTRGFVDRTHSEDDRRRISLGITPEGETVLAAADRAVNDRLEQIAARPPECPSRLRGRSTTCRCGTRRSSSTGPRRTPK